jgi:hypothetical protein
MKYKVKIRKPPVVNKFRVYFDIDTGKLLGITNKILDQYPTYFEVPVQEVEDFLVGSRDMLRHKVIFDVKEQNYKIVSHQESVIAYVDDHIFRINHIKSPQVIVVQDFNNKCWTISASTEVKERMKEVGARLEEVMLFSITQYNNPNILHNHFYVRLRDIIEKDSVQFNFISQIEEEIGEVSVYTNKKFERYSHEVAHG